jgi:DNA-binding transcriptional regulator YiaG
MLSPYTGKEMKVVYEPRTWNFRGEEYEYIHTAYVCEDTHEQFTTNESDDAGFLQVTNQYRAKYGIPFTDEIVAIRARYGVSAAKMSAILGIGTNQWRLYESGEVPSVSNGRMIRSIMNPKVFLDLVESARQLLTDKEYKNITAKVQQVIAQSDKYHIDAYECRRLFSVARGVENGYSPISLERVKAVMLTILQECGEVFCTKMNKLLFYIDFLSYRQRGIAITGLCFRAIDFGPVPDR